MKKLKVWGGYIFHGKEQVRGIIATYTKKKAMELLKCDYKYFQNRFCETGNDLEIKIALSRPETLFFSSGVMKKDFKKCLVKK